MAVSVASLRKFILVDIYEAFYEVLPEARYSDPRQKEEVSRILKKCCNTLIRLLQEEGGYRLLKKALSDCMDELFLASIDPVNREFGYQLGWFLAEKAGVDLSRGTERKVWGYWKLEGDVVKVISGSRKKRVGSH